MNAVIYVVIGVVTLAIGLVGGYLLRRFTAQSKLGSAETEAEKLLQTARDKAEATKKEALIEAKEQAYSLRSDIEKETKERRAELSATEKRLTQKEELLEQKTGALEQKAAEVELRSSTIEAERAKLVNLQEKEKVLLEKIAGLSAEDAKGIMLKNIEDDVRREAAIMIRRVESEAKDEADKKARHLLATAIQRCASDHTAETTVSVVQLPGDDMKGRIIGREGRNIRAFETVTGINLIIDDTPEAVILSSFDPVRREIARITLEKLMADGRIHPARIEETYEKAKADVDNQIREAGEQAVLETGVHNLNPELTRVLGRLKYRTSYGQNVLQHSLEVAHLAGIMASELGADVRLAKRCGLLHDLGKAIDQDVEGPHAVIGAELAKRFGEKPDVVNAIEAHHEEIEPTTVEAVLIQAGDAISASRPGARRETLESYVKRLEKLEALAESYKGVEKSYAMQAGREIRIMVRPGEIDDGESMLLAREIAKDIEEQLQYPGQIKVTVIRENRAVEYAR